MFSIHKFLFSMLFALMITIPAFASDDQSNANGCVRDYPKQETSAGVVEKIVVRKRCFTLRFPDYPGVEFELYVEKVGKNVTYGEITGICGDLWIIDGGTLTRNYMFLYGHCAGDCSVCLNLEVVFEGIRVSRKCYSGFSTWDQGALVTDFNACKHRCH